MFRERRRRGEIYSEEDVLEAVKEKKIETRRRGGGRKLEWRKHDGFYPTFATLLSPEFPRVTEKKGPEQFQDPARCEQRWVKVK